MNSKSPLEGQRKTSSVSRVLSEINFIALPMLGLLFYFRAVPVLLLLLNRNSRLMIRILHELQPKERKGSIPLIFDRR